MALLKPILVSTKNFSYNRASKTFTAEMSDLGPNFQFGQVYDDACDVGLTLISHLTDKEVVFAIHEVQQNRDNEITVWVLNSVTPKYKGYWIRIYND